MTNRIGIIGGDGIGPEVTDVAVNAAKFLLKDEVDIIAFPDLTTKNWVESRNDLDELKMDKILSTDAIFLGAVGDDLDITYHGILFLGIKNQKILICLLLEKIPKVFIGKLVDGKTRVRKTRWLGKEVNTREKVLKELFVMHLN